MTDGAVCALLVVDREPFLGDGSCVVQGAELMCVEDFQSVRSVESLDVGVLRRTTWLDEVPADVVAFAHVCTVSLSGLPFASQGGSAAASYIDSRA